MDAANTVMQVFKAFGAKTNPNVRITKIGCVEGHPAKIPIGQIIEGTFTNAVEIGRSFNIADATERTIKDGKILKGNNHRYWCTSIIQKVLSNNTFETKNSIYKWEFI